MTGLRIKNKPGPIRYKQVYIRCPRCRDKRLVEEIFHLGESRFRLCQSCEMAVAEFEESPTWKATVWHAIVEQDALLNRLEWKVPGPYSDEQLAERQRQREEAKHQYAEWVAERLAERAAWEATRQAREAADILAIMEAEAERKDEAAAKAEHEAARKDETKKEAERERVAAEEASRLRMELEAKERDAARQFAEIDADLAYAETYAQVTEQMQREQKNPITIEANAIMEAKKARGTRLQMLLKLGPYKED